MFGSILIAAYTTLLVYVTWRCTSVAMITSRVSHKSLLAISLGLWVVFFLALVYGHHGTGIAAAVLELIGMTFLGSLFLTSTVLFVVDCGTGFGRLFSNWAPTLRGGAVVAGLLLSFLALVQGFRAPVVASYDVTLPSLPANLDGTVLVAVSDTHLGTDLKERWFTKRISEVQRLRPDIVVFLGDIFEGHGTKVRDVPVLRQLSAPLGKWFVDGNHESHRDEGASTDVLEQAGFRRLAGEWAQLAPGLVLAGVIDLTHHKDRDLEGDPLGRALADRPAGATVLLSHSPRLADRVAHAGVRLMLCGHTHGGQIWPFGYLVQIFYPLLAGRYEVDGMPVIVCRGTGTWGPPMRLWLRGEILKVSLHSG